MAENPGDLNLPLAVISRIIADAIPAGTNVSVETRKAIAKAASVFVLYVTASAAAMATKRNRKTTLAQDVLDGIVEMEFTQFLGPLKKALDNYQQNLKKKPRLSKKPDGAEENASSSKSKSKSPTPKSPKSKKKVPDPDVEEVSESE